MSRQKGTIFFRLLALSFVILPIYSQRVRHHSLYIYGKIGLTLSLLLSLFDPMNELGKLQQICHAKGGATGSHHYTGIRGGKAGPGRWQRPDAIWRLVKGDAVFPPVVPIAEHLKLLAVQGMKGMGHRENSFR
jgi:hypothetical protein